MTTGITLDETATEMPIAFGKDETHVGHLKSIGALIQAAGSTSYIARRPQASSHHAT